MQIFGIQITKPKVNFPMPEIQDTLPGGERLKSLRDLSIGQEVSIPAVHRRPNASKIARLNNPSLLYRGAANFSRGVFRVPEYALSEVGRIEDVDSYVRQAHKKKIALMFKEGWQITGKNKRFAKYIKARLRQMEAASGIPTDRLLRSMGRDLIRLSNAFLVKVRNVDASGGQERKIPGTNKTLKPVAAYFPLPAEQMEVDVDKHGNVRKWKLSMPNGDFKEFSKEDIIHIHYDRKQGFLFGTPMLVPVIDDIRALRKIEENIEILVYQHLFPLFQYKIGDDDNPAGILPNGTDEIDFVKAAIEFMPSEGGIVTPHRHEIKMIGAEGKALRAESYLKHFKERVFAGLGMSSIDFGEGDTANRSTADNMSRNLVDDVKDFQSVFASFFNSEIIAELMLESTFDPEDFLEEDNVIFLHFNEIDLENQFKRETHHADLFAKNVLHWDETRTRMGLEPIPIPSRADMRSGSEDLDQLFPEWFKTNWKMFKEPELLIQSIDEPYSAEAKAVARANTTEVTQQGLNEEESARRQEKEREQKAKTSTSAGKSTTVKASKTNKSSAGNTNQFGTTFGKRKSSFNGQTGISLSDNLVSNHFKEFKHFVLHNQSFNTDWTHKVGITIGNSMKKELLFQMRRNFIRGYINTNDDAVMAGVSIARKMPELERRGTIFVDRFVDSIIAAFRRHRVDTLDPDGRISTINSIFDSLAFRLDFILDVEPRKAFNFGRINALKDTGVTTIGVHTSETACERCNSHPTVQDISFIGLDDVFPGHAHCNCDFAAIKDFSQVTEPDIGEASEQHMEKTGQISPCPSCNNKVIQRNGTFFCRTCRKGFAPKEETE